MAKNKISKSKPHGKGVVIRDKIRGYVFEPIHILFVFVKFDGARRAGACSRRTGLGCDKHDNVTQEFHVAVKTLLNTIFCGGSKPPPYNDYRKSLITANPYHYPPYRGVICLSLYFIFFF